MDHLFPETEDTVGMMESYEQAVFDYEQAGRKKKSTKKVRKPIPKEFQELTQLTRYQLRKQILPAYSEPVLDILVRRQYESISYSEEAKRQVFNWTGREVSMVTGAELERLGKAKRLPEAGLRVGVAVYVEDVRLFEYGEKDAKTGARRNPKHACELVVDVDGFRTKFVKWPDRETGRLASNYNPTLKDSIAILVLSKFKEKRPFSVEDIEIVQAAPSEGEKDQDKEESP
jgi:hypothetical protein